MVHNDWKMKNATKEEMANEFLEAYIAAKNRSKFKNSPDTDVWKEIEKNTAVWEMSLNLQKNGCRYQDLKNHSRNIVFCWKKYDRSCCYPKFM